MKELEQVEMKELLKSQISSIVPEYGAVETRSILAAEQHP